MAVSPLGRSAFALERNKPDITHIIIGKQTSSVSGFDPHLNASAPAAEIIGNLYETLVTLKSGTPAAGLADKWTKTGSTWTFPIVSGRKFASRNTVTAVDAAFSLRRALKINNSLALPLAHLGLTIGNADKCITVAENGNALVISLPTQVEDNIVLHCLTSAGCSILDSNLVERRHSPKLSVLDTHGCAPLGDSYHPPQVLFPYLCRFAATDDGEAWLRFNSAGSGPFVISNAVRTDEIVLQRNVCHPDYVKSAKPLIVRDIADPREQQRLLRRGEIQVAWNTTVEPSPAGAPKLHASKEKEPSTDSTFDFVEHGKANLLLLCMNVSKTPLNDPNIRKSIRQAIDTNALKTQRWKAQDRFFPSEIGGFKIEVPAPHDLEEAKKALANHKCSLKLDYLAVAGRSAVANRLAWQLAAAGISLALDPTASGYTFQERLEKREFDLALVSFSSDYLHPHSNAYALCANSDWEEHNTFDGPRTLAWYCHWRDDDIMKRVADAAKASGPEGQLQAYKDIQSELFKRGPYAFLLDETVHVKGVKGFLPQLGALDNQTRFSPPKPKPT